MFKQLLRGTLLAGLALSAAPSLAQDYGYSVLIDLDRQSGTGCTVDLGGGNVVAGVERRLSAWSSSGVFQVASLTLEVCQSGSFGPATGVGGPYPIGLNNGVGGADVVELGADIQQLTGLAYPQPFRAYFGAESAAGSDLIGSTSGGGAIIVGTPAAPVPGLGWLGLVILVAACVLILRARRLRPLLRNSGLALLVLGSGLVIAANWVLDGQVGDWAGRQPTATDPAGDSTSGQSSIDMTAAFVAFENGNAFFRIDVRDVQNNPPTAHPGTATGLEDTPLVVALSGIDNESPTLSFAIASVPASGTLGPITMVTPTTAEVTYTPDADSNGADNFTFTVNDGELTSAPATIGLTIQPVNDAPSFTAQNATIFEDGGAQTATVATDILAGPSDEAGQSLSFDITGNDNPGLFSGTPIISPAGVLSATPAPGLTGSASLTVVLRDNGGTANGGIDASAAQTIVVTVDDVNDPPSFTPGAAPTVLEDAGAQTLVNWATAIDDGDGGGQALTFIVQSNSNPALFADAPAITAGGTLSFSTAADANGSAAITVVLTDDGGTANGGNDTSPPHTFTITVTPVNDAPSFTAVDPPSVFQDSGPAEVAGWATFNAGPANESGQVALEYQVSAISNAALFSAAPTVEAATGTLRYTPAAGARGTSQFTVRVRDDGGTADGGVDLSDPQTFTITVEAVNNPPSFTPGPDVTVLEDVGAHTVPAWATAIDDNDGGTQVLTFVVQNNSNPGLFVAAPVVNAGTGALSFTPADDANGSAQITLVLQDDGGTANGGNDTSPPHVLTITVTPVNDAPSFTLQDPPASLEDAGAQSAIAATAISAGPPDESGQTVSFTVTPVSSDATLTFASAPVISPAGTLSYTAATNAWGTATFDVVAQDNGGMANGGVDTSAAQTLTITITAVNDAPSFTATDPAASAEDAGPQNVGGWVTGFDPGPNEAGQVAAEYLVSAVSNPGLFSAAPVVAADGTLSYTAAADQFGTSQFTVRVRDDGGTANGGIDLSTAQTFTITVTAVNDPPVLDLNGPAAGTGYSANFTEGAAPVAIVDAAAMTVTDIDSAQLVSATVTITNVLNGVDEVLAVDATGSGLTVNYAAGVLALTGSAAPSVYQTVLRTTTYANASNNPDETPRLIEFIAEDADGGVSAPPAVATVSVAGVNSAPVFTPGANQAALEDAGTQTVPAWATGIHDGDDGTQGLTFVIQGNSNPALFAAGPAIAVDGTLTYTPADDANGTASITVVLEDDGGTANGGSNTSAPATLVISVTAVNDAPSFTVPATAPPVLENAGAQTVAGFAQDILAGPPDEAGQALIFTVTVTGTTSSLAFTSAPSINVATGTLTYTPQTDTSGTATVEVVLSDNGGTANGGADTSAAQTFTIDVQGVNSAPVFTPGGPVTVNEDSGAYDQPWATGIDDGDLDEVQALEFIVQANSNPGLFSAGPAVDAVTGNLSFDLAADAFGVASITLVLRDDGGTANSGVDTSSPVTFNITVQGINDPPSFDLPASAPAVLEDDGAQTVAGFASNMSTGPANESGQMLTGFTVTIDSADATLGFSAAPAISLATGTLTYTPAANAFGTATLTATLQDDGGTANGGIDTFSRSFTITVTGVNDAPSFTPGGNVTVSEDAGAQTIPAWATGMNDGDGGTQALTFVITNNTNPALFSGQPAIDVGTGNLSFTSAANAFGTADITVVLQDNGGTANGGVDATTPETFTITVTAVNDPPVVVVPSNVAVHRHIGIVVPAAHAHNLLANVSDVDGPGAAPFSLTEVSNAASAGGGRYSTLADGSWTYHPPAGNTATSDSFDVQVCDSGVPLPPACATATVTITLSGQAIWFVDATAPAGGDGTLARPLQTLGGAVTAAGTNGRIFKFSGNHAGGATLLNGQHLIGQGATGASFDALFGITPPALSVARPAIGGARPLLTTTSGTAHGITLGSGNTIRGIEIGNTSGAGLFGDNFGTLTLGENRIGGSGQALNLSNGTLAQVSGFDAFDQVSSSSGSNNIALTAVNGTANLGTGALSGASGTAFHVSGGTATLSYAGTVTAAAGQRPLNIESKSGGTVTLSGAVSSTAQGVRLAANGGATIRLAGGLSLSTGANPAFAATGGGTVEVCDEHPCNPAATGALVNTLQATTATALQVSDTSIGSNRLEFRSISSSGGNATGIILENTGSSGGLTVNGTGAAGSGGTIANKNGANGATANGIGIYLSQTRSVRLNRMQLTGFQNFAIRGFNVVDFELRDSVVNGNNGNSAGDDEGSIRFDNLTGSAVVANSAISGGYEDNFNLVNTLGTLNRITFDAVNFGSNHAAEGNDGLFVGAYGTSVVNVTVQNSQFTAARGDLFQMSVPTSGSADLVFTGNTLSNNHPGIATGGGGVTISGENASTFTLNMNNNSFRDAVGHAVLIGKGLGTGSLRGNVTNNTVGVAAVANSGSLEGDGIKIHHWGGGQVTMLVSGNQVRQYNNQGIHLQAGAGAVQGGDFNVTVTGNTIANPGNNPAVPLIFQGLHLNNGVTPGDNFQTCVNIGANTITGSGRNGGTDFRLRQRQSTTVRLPGYAGTSTNTAAVIAFVQGNLVTAASGSAAVESPPGGGFVGGAACPLP